MIPNININTYNLSNSKKHKIKHHDVIFINITRQSTQLFKIIDVIKNLKKQKNLFLIGISTASLLNSKNKNKFYKIGIDTILNCPIKKTDISVLFNIIAQKL